MHKNFFLFHELVLATVPRITSDMKKWQSERCITSCNAKIENEWSYASFPTYIGSVMFSAQESFSHTEFYN